MTRVRGEPKQRWTHGEQSKHNRGNYSARFIQHLARELEQEDGGGGVDQSQPEMYAGGGLAEERHDQGVGGVSAGKFHVVNEFVGRNTLQHELAGVSELPFVAFERHVAEADAN